MQPLFPFEYLHGEPLLAGSIKNTPADFRVDEELSFEIAGHGEHVYLHLLKTGANSGWVASEIARFAGIRDMDVSFAGRKDRHAETRQWFSCYVPGQEQPDWTSLDIEGTTVLDVKRHTRKLRRGEISRNSFELLVRHEGADDMRRLIDHRLELIGSAGFPNYFGPQRFGRDGQNLDRARQLLVNGEKVHARGMVLSAARGWLFNHYLSGWIAGGNVADPEVEGPLIGKSRDPQPGELELDEDMTAWVAGLRRLGMKADKRKLFVVPEALDWEHVDTGVRLNFALPAGSFATSLIREVFEVRDASER